MRANVDLFLAATLDEYDYDENSDNDASDRGAAARVGAAAIRTLATGCIGVIAVFTFRHGIERLSPTNLITCSHYDTAVNQLSAYFNITKIF